MPKITVGQARQVPLRWLLLRQRHAVALWKWNHRPFGKEFQLFRTGVGVTVRIWTACWYGWRSEWSPASQAARRPPAGTRVPGVGAPRAVSRADG